jgi:hypothetical protein
LKQQQAKLVDTLVKSVQVEMRPFEMAPGGLYPTTAPPP